MTCITKFRCDNPDCKLQEIGFELESEHGEQPEPENYRCPDCEEKLTFDREVRDPTRYHLQHLAKTVRFHRLGELLPCQWLLDNGREFRLGGLPKGVRRRARKQCYRNSLELANGNRIGGDGRYVYCEGVATKGTLTTEHAWCYDRETGLIVDVTWLEEGSFYWGVPIRTAYACSRHDLPVLWDWRNDYPIITGVVPESIWRENLP